MKRNTETSQDRFEWSALESQVVAVVKAQLQPLNYFKTQATQNFQTQDLKIARLSE